MTGVVYKQRENREQRKHDFAVRSSRLDVLAKAVLVRLSPGCLTPSSIPFTNDNFAPGGSRSLGVLTTSAT